jgi:hypothetical protein
MTAPHAADPPSVELPAMAEILRSAKRLGVELDEHEAAAWVAAMEAEATGGNIVVDVTTGVYGHRVTMLDFSAGDLARFRAIGRIVGFDDRPPHVRTALALSGSAAQSKIQTYPGDCDFFERVHIMADTRDDACRVLRGLMREKALATMTGPTFRLWEVKFGVYPIDAERDGAGVGKGGTITWKPAEIAAGAVAVSRGGEALEIRWDDVGVPDTGWCKLDWIVADPARRALANASNVLDVTWEAPDGTVTPLDGFIDPYFQEVYLEADSLPLFTRLVSKMSADAVDDYVDALEHEVWKYTGGRGDHEVSYGKAARRMYNVFRLTGRYGEAAYLRELFDEPTTVLYQVAALIRTIDEADRPGAAFDREVLVSQADTLIMAAVTALEGKAEADMVRRLLRVRDSLVRPATGRRARDVERVQSGAMRAVNAYFKRRLFAVPGIASYIRELHERERPADHGAAARA